MERLGSWSAVSPSKPPKCGLESDVGVPKLSIGEALAILAEEDMNGPNESTREDLRRLQKTPPTMEWRGH